MSKIKKEVVEVTGLTAKRGEDEQDHAKRLVRGMADLSDKDWDGLSPEAQTWYNDAATAMNKKKELPAFPDAEEAAEDPPPRRRAAAAKDEPEAAAEPKAGDDVRVITKRDKVIEGKLIEIDGDTYVIDDGKEELEVTKDRIKSIEVAGLTGAPKDEPEAPGDPKVGDTIKITTKRGKTVEGKLVEIDGDTFIIDDGKEELEVGADSIKTCEIVGGKTEKAEARTRTASAGKTERAEAPAKDAKKITAKANGGTSVTTRTREIICETPDISKDDVIAALKAEKLEFRESTIDLVYADTVKVIGILRDLKKLK